MESAGDAKKRYVLEEVPETGTNSTTLNTQNIFDEDQNMKNKTVNNTLVLDDQGNKVNQENRFSIDQSITGRAKCR